MSPEQARAQRRSSQRSLVLRGRADRDADRRSRVRRRDRLSRARGGAARRPRLVAAASAHPGAGPAPAAALSREGSPGAVAAAASPDWRFTDALGDFDARRPSVRPRRGAMALAGMAVAAAAIAALATWTLLRRAPDEADPPSRFLITPSSGAPFRLSPFERALALSADGRQLVYGSVAPGRPGGPLIVRSLGEIETRRLPDVVTARQPFFSPDGRWIGYFDGRRWKGARRRARSSRSARCRARRAAPAGGTTATSCSRRTDPGTGLLQVSQEGGEPKPLTTPDPDRRGNDHVWPSLLPGARGVLFTIIPSSGRPVERGRRPRPRVVARRDARARWQPAGVRRRPSAVRDWRPLFAAPFDLESLKVVR